jgi:hypothetical protein
LAFVDRCGARRLGQFDPIRIDGYRQMCVLGSGQTQCGLQGNLARRAGQEVGAAHDMRDVLSGVVDDDCQLISEQTVAPADHEVAGRARQLRSLRTL